MSEGSGGAGSSGSMEPPSTVHVDPTQSDTPSRDSIHERNSTTITLRNSSEKEMLTTSPGDDGSSPAFPTNPTIPSTISQPGEWEFSWPSSPRTSTIRETAPVASSTPAGPHPSRTTLITETRPTSTFPTPSSQQTMTHAVPHSTVTPTDPRELGRTNTPPLPTTTPTKEATPGTTHTTPLPTTTRRLGTTHATPHPPTTSPTPGRHPTVREVMTPANDRSPSDPHPTATPSTSTTEFRLDDIVPGNLSCFACNLDFREFEYDMDHPCLGRHTPLDRAYVVRCGIKDRYCKVEVTQVNGVLTQLRRECTEVCYYGCRLRGFGIRNLVCSQCCNRHGCNRDFPTAAASVLWPGREVLLAGLLPALAARIP
ncbi:unnamed protein product [Darwinula stevensoni]|uniref:Uncharacterized protein n=1 Tax=Darwinula stevensoni TaxID=69355 RepID=A0A7R9FSU3_9CRUS|nr:unnamed protein product [Darwinula stevensoni]CAG0904521.1 unnamed protein product [Darwinula stevensoni]